MDLSKLLRPPSLTDQVFQILFDRIDHGTYPPGSKLPNENELIKEFSISRVTLRSAYAKLEERGMIQRRQGAGTYVTGRHTITSLQYQVMDFGDWISRQGCRVGFKQLDARIFDSEAHIASRLNIDPGSQSLRLEKVWTADGQPIIHLVTYVCLWIFEGIFSPDELTLPGLTEPFFQFLDQKCNTRVDYLASSIFPKKVSQCNLPADFVLVKPNTPLLVVEDIGFTAEGKPVFYSIEHLLGIACKMQTLRRVLQ